MAETLIEVGGGRAIVLRDDAASSRLRHGVDKGLPTNTEYALACAVRDLQARLVEIERAARNLRQAQRDYLADRGNEMLGQRVGEAAAALDAVLPTIQVARP